MYRIIRIGDKEIPMKAMASVDRYYKRIFHVDPIKLQSSGEIDDGDMVEFVMQMGFIMAKFAELNDGAKMANLNEDDYTAWLDGFERTDYLNALLDIRLAYEGQSATVVEAKKKQRRTERVMTTALFVLRAIQIGLRLEDLDSLEYGEVVDLMIESANDDYEYKILATQEDFDRF